MIDVTMQEPKLIAEVEAHPHPLLFATVSGAHLYGFPPTSRRRRCSPASTASRRR